jgi:hypothetical protein
MKAIARWLPAGGLLGLVVLLAAGCATTKVDWEAYVGHLTFDEAVLQMGPPDKQAKLQDGTVIAEWVTRRASHTMVVGGAFSVYDYYPRGAYLVPPPTYSDFYSPEYFLRLNFGPDGKLQSWKKLRR